jgi:hypothetical protein
VLIDSFAEIATTDAWRMLFQKEQNYSICFFAFYYLFPVWKIGVILDDRKRQVDKIG